MNNITNLFILIYEILKKKCSFECSSLNTPLERNNNDKNISLTFALEPCNIYKLEKYKTNWVSHLSNQYIVGHEYFGTHIPQQKHRSITNSLIWLDYQNLSGSQIHFISSYLISIIIMVDFKYIQYVLHSKSISQIKFFSPNQITRSKLHLN